MDGLAAARTLRRDAVPPARGATAAERGRFAIGPAASRDDPDIRALLRDSAFPGVVRLSFEREPDSRAAHVEGDVHGVIVARERATGRLAGIASRSSRLRFVNGSSMRVGYLGQLRIAPGFGVRRELLNDGFRFCRDLHERDSATVYLASVIAENHAARRLLERGAGGWPVFRAVDDLVTLAIPARGARRFVSSGVSVSSGEGRSHEVTGVLSRHNARYQFAPCWADDDLVCQPGLMSSDFVVAERGGAIAGCAALWDQRAFKQVVVRGYSRTLERVRPLMNLFAPVLGIPALPPVGSPLAFAHVSHLAVEDDEADVACALIAAAQRAARARQLEYITIGMSRRRPLLERVRRAFAHRMYSSVLYVAFWPDGEPVAAALDGRPSHPEMAIL